jgi:hypothetical protein
MQDYETHIYKADGSISLVAINRHTSDFAAIRAALHLCKKGDTARVWRNDKCVYTDILRTGSSLEWPIQSNVASL